MVWAVLGGVGLGGIALWLLVEQSRSAGRQKAAREQSEAAHRARRRMQDVDASTPSEVQAALREGDY